MYEDLECFVIEKTKPDFLDRSFTAAVLVNGTHHDFGAAFERISENTGADRREAQGMDPFRIREAKRVRCSIPELLVLVSFTHLRPDCMYDKSGF
jgi:hypothetical protein